MLNELLSFVWDRQIAKRFSEKNGWLQVNLRNGRLVLDTATANYSYGALHQVFRKVFDQIDPVLSNTDEVLVLGLGGGSIPSILYKERGFTGKMTGIEYDPVVLELAKKYFNIDSFTDLTAICTDARSFLRENQTKFKLVIVDLFKDRHVDPTFFSEAFVRSLIAATAENGMLFFNVMVEDARTVEHFKQLETMFTQNQFSIEVVRYAEFNRVLVARR